MSGLFAQMNNRGGANNNLGGAGGAGAAGGPDEVVWIVIVIAMLAMLVVMLGVFILFFMTLSKCLKRCSPRNRTMEPGQVWLNFIPCFNLVWSFITVIRIDESLHREFRDRGYPRQSDYGKSIGITCLIMNLCANIPYIGIIFSLIWLVLFIVYWVKIAGYSKELAEGPSFRGERDRYDDYDDRRGDYDDDRRDYPPPPPPPPGGHYDEQKDDLDDKPWRRR